jgi:hypothetical protein
MSKVDGNRRVVFPAFASHWAVIVYESQFSTQGGLGYHLTFRKAAAAQISPAANVSREVKFTVMILEEMPEEVGITRFRNDQSLRIVPSSFLELPDSVITDGVGKFDEWPFSQTSNLCAFIVTIPCNQQDAEGERYYCLLS